jgi:hypothetical protein
LTKFSDDGLSYWDGTQWLSAISADGAWKWTEAGWVANRPLGSGSSGWPKIWRIGSWVLAGLAILVLLLSVIVLIVFIGEQSAGSPTAFGTLGTGLVLVSLAVLLATPSTLRVARRRGFFLSAAITAGCIFLGSCGGGLTLVAAYPTPTPSSVAERPAHRPAPTPTPVALLPAGTASPGASPSLLISPAPSPSPSPSAAPSPSPSPSAAPSPSPTPKPTPRPTPKPTPKPTVKPVVNLCGAPSNPWHYNFCGRGGVIRNPPSNFCAYFSPCVSTFWTATRGYVVQCFSGKWSHSGGVSGACSSNGGVRRILYSGP